MTSPGGYLPGEPVPWACVKTEDGGHEIIIPKSWAERLGLRNLEELARRAEEEDEDA